VLLGLYYSSYCLTSLIFVIDWILNSVFVTQRDLKLDIFPWDTGFDWLWLNKASLVICNKLSYVFWPYSTLILMNHLPYVTVMVWCLLINLHIFLYLQLLCLLAVTVSTLLTGVSEKKSGFVHMILWPSNSMLIKYGYHYLLCCVLMF